MTFICQKCKKLYAPPPSGGRCCVRDNGIVRELPQGVYMCKCGQLMHQYFGFRHPK